MNAFQAAELAAKRREILTAYAAQTEEAVAEQIQRGIQHAAAEAASNGLFSTKIAVDLIPAVAHISGDAKTSAIETGVNRSREQDGFVVSYTVAASTAPMATDTVVLNISW